MSFVDAYREECARWDARARGAPLERGRRGRDSELIRGPFRPTPIKIGYYLNRRLQQIEQPNFYHGERALLCFGLMGAGKQTRFLTELNGMVT